jgi:signal transduction histidine kinase
LSIVYGIAKEAGGTVSFFTSRNEGTTFEVLLPLVASS